MNPIRKKRALNIIFVFVFSITGVSLILYSLNTNLDYFFTPTELKQENIPTDKRIKVGGMVQKDSVERNLSKISFVITDYENSIKVTYDGIVPDLFKEESGVVVLGYQKNQMIYAEEVLAKHDENYMPPNIAIQK
ncbi:MAG: cytochrome c maturation protein CcmE [Gammaproteobacteria bacterium]|jgi:cytochrome c-type biogenesis protein CcmE|tara:strand:+ start:330 stop:734 length:405 start_codon:yes stop_codon:yes gene_type:complete